MNLQESLVNEQNSSNKIPCKNITGRNESRSNHSTILMDLETLVKYLDIKTLTQMHSMLDDKNGNIN